MRQLRHTGLAATTDLDHPYACVQGCTAPAEITLIELQRWPFDFLPFAKGLTMWRLVILLAVLCASCAELPSEVHSSVPWLAVMMQDSAYCATDPECGGGTDGTIHDGTADGTLNEPTNDPSPGAAGIWLGHMVTGEECYGDYNASVIDHDDDWLDDYCEVVLAKAFAPALNIAFFDDCQLGEPYWAAKYFDQPAGRTWGERVRIAYMPGYYEDCGTLGRKGDSEFIMVEVHYNPATMHWEWKSMFLSAHAGTITNSSDWITNPGDAEFPSGRYLSYPRVWVAKDKHANYASRDACNAGAVGSDSCSLHGAWGGRMRIDEHRNVGSRTYDRLGCQPSDNALYYENGRQECFYTRSNFKGWQKTSQSGVTPYYDFLMSQAYECFAYAGLPLSYCYYGAGVISGP